MTFSVPTTRFAFTDRRMVRIVEPGDVEVWVGSHAAASAGTLTEEATGGAIVSKKKRRRARVLQGSSTERAIVAITGAVYEVTVADPRMVDVSLAAPAAVRRRRWSSDVVGMASPGQASTRPASRSPSR